ncbi:MAG: IS1595 family transposase [Bryobacteraceae bacterium]
MNLIDVAKQFGSPEACNDFLESLRWPEGVVCVKCGGKRVSKYVKAAGVRTRMNAKTGKAEEKPVPARILYVCLDCHEQFSVTEGTIFNDSHLPLDKWFMAAALMVNAKKGMSALQLKRDLNVAYKTSWYLSHRIRKAMGLIEEADDKQLTGTVEVDETYMGSKKYDKRRKRAKYEKEPVFGMIERKGRARTYHVARMNRFNVIGKIADGISPAADLVCTDESSLYHRMPKNVERHEIVNHSAKEYVRGVVHTGTIDGYWGLLKRGIIGNFHHVSIKHLGRYLSEFEFKWNNRDNEHIWVLVIAALVIGSALPYKELIAIADQEPENGPEGTLDGEPF